MIRLIICLACATIFVACHSNVSETNNADQISKSVAAKFIPDSREDLFQIQFKTGKSGLIVCGETTKPEAKQALLSELALSKISFTDSIKTLPDPVLGSKIWALVDISVCNIRTQPGHNAEMSTQACLGAPVRLLKKSGHWSYIQTPDHYLGWVDDDALYQTDSVGMASWRTGKRVIYLPLIGSAVNPESGEAVTDVVAGSILKLITTSRDKSILEMPDGRRLSLPSNEVIDFDTWKKSVGPSPETLTKFAKSLMGRPYLWGGTSPKGVDCSGFVKTVYFMNGVILARDASLQFRHGAVTEPQSGYEKLKVGDLVFFGRKAEGNRPARATHVGMYLGDGAYINSSGFVKVDSFDPGQKNYSKVRAGSWLGGRTIIGSEGSAGIVRVKDHPWY
jgi:hypothetical protein